MLPRFPDFSGKTIDHGRLQLLELIGRGGYSVVYRATDTTVTGEPYYYSVKCLLQSSDKIQHDIESQEISYHELVSPHPHVVTIHKTLFDGPFIFVVLDYYPGDLFSAIIDEGRFKNNNERIKTAFLQLALALQWCHHRGVFHRDIKPENILCDKDNVYLADFGLATTDDLSSKFGVGSSSYMSPECLREEIKLKNYSCRGSDIWALGIILCNLISGQNPWKLATTGDPRFSHYLHNPDSLRTNLNLSPATADILHRIFTLNPFARISLPDLVNEVRNLDTFFADLGSETVTSERVDSRIDIVITVTGASQEAGYDVRQKHFDYSVDDWDSPLEETDDKDYALHAPLPSFGVQPDAWKPDTKAIALLTDVATASRTSAILGLPPTCCSSREPGHPGTGYYRSSRGVFSFAHSDSGPPSHSGYSSSEISSAGPLTPPEHEPVPSCQPPSLDKCEASMYHSKVSVVAEEEFFDRAIEKLLALNAT